MKLDDAKAKFIADWGRFGANWGINRTMAQIHALLLISPDALSAEEVMNKLDISRGNANMNLRELMDWGLVQKVLKPGERREFFSAEKDIWKVARQIVKERKKRELDQLIPVLKELSEVDTRDADEKELKAFKETIRNLRKFSEQADKTLDTMIRADEHWFLGSLVKLFGAAGR